MLQLWFYHLAINLLVPQILCRFLESTEKVQGAAVDLLARCPRIGHTFCPKNIKFLGLGMLDFNSANYLHGYYVHQKLIFPNDKWLIEPRRHAVRSYSFFSELMSKRPCEFS